MYTNRLLMGSAVLAIAALAPALVLAQGRTGGPVFKEATRALEILNVESENIPTITNAPFTAEATTEFTQTLSDGNRIERRYTTSLARDGRGRTRREQDVAILNPVVVFQGVRVQTRVAAGGGGTPVNWTMATPQGTPPRLVVISNPVEGATYSLDEARKEARRSPSNLRSFNVLRGEEMKKLEAAAASATSPDTVVEQLGTRQFEGVSAEGVQSTTTIPAGEIGNLNPIHLVTERWFSPELQMPVLITRKDPRSGDTTYRLTNVVRAEPPPDLFAVPADYRVIDPKKAYADDMMREVEKLKKALDAQRLVAPKP